MQKCDIRCADDIFAYANMIYFAKGKICRGLRPAFYIYNQNAQRFPSCFATAKYIIFSLAKIYHKPLAYIILQSNISLFQFVAQRQTEISPFPNTIPPTYLCIFTGIVNRPFIFEGLKACFSPVWAGFLGKIRFL